MKKTLLSTLLAAVLVSCGQPKQEAVKQLPTRTPEAEKLLANLKTIPQKVCKGKRVYTESNFKK